MKETTNMVKPTTKGAVIRICIRVDLIVVTGLSGEYLRLKSR